MRSLRLLHLAVLVVALALVAPSPAVAAGGADGVARPVLTASALQAGPDTTVVLTATAEREIIGGTWKVRDGAGKWRRLARWSDPDAHTGTVTREVRSLGEAGTRSFKVVIRMPDGSAVSNPVTVRTVTEPAEPASDDPSGGADFTAVTWNVYFGTPVAELRPILRRLLDDGVSLFLMQEMSNPLARRMLEDHGLAVHYVAYQWVVAWDPSVWTARSTAGKRLSPTSFTRWDGRGPIYVDSALAVLEDRAGRTLDVMSYHLPPNVQVRHPEKRRLRIHRESAASWRSLVDASTSDAMLFGGDDNVDEKNGYRSNTDFWSFMKRKATGLRQVVAPTGTIGRHRRIDDFRIRGLRAGAGWTGDGGGDHRFFASEFSWR